MNLADRFSDEDLEIIQAICDQAVKQATFTERLIRLPEVMELVGLKRTTILNMIREGQFPTGIKIERARLWQFSVVQDWIKSKALDLQVLIP